MNYLLKLQRQRQPQPVEEEMEVMEVPTDNREEVEIVINNTSDPRDIVETTIYDVEKSVRSADPAILATRGVNATHHGLFFTKGERDTVRQFLKQRSRFVHHAGRAVDMAPLCRLGADWEITKGQEFDFAADTFYLWKNESGENQLLGYVEGCYVGTVVFRARIPEREGWQEVRIDGRSIIFEHSMVHLSTRYISNTFLCWDTVVSKSMSVEPTLTYGISQATIVPAFYVQISLDINGDRGYMSFVVESHTVLHIQGTLKETYERVRIAAPFCPIYSVDTERDIRALAFAHSGDRNQDPVVEMRGAGFYEREVHWNGLVLFEFRVKTMGTPPVHAASSWEVHEAVKRARYARALYGGKLLAQTLYIDKNLKLGRDRIELNPEGIRRIPMTDRDKRQIFSGHYVWYFAARRVFEKVARFESIHSGVPYVEHRTDYDLNRRPLTDHRKRALLCLSLIHGGIVRGGPFPGAIYFSDDRRIYRPGVQRILLAKVGPEPFSLLPPSQSNTDYAALFATVKDNRPPLDSMFEWRDENNLRHRTEVLDDLNDGVRLETRVRMPVAIRPTGPIVMNWENHDVPVNSLSPSSS